MIGIVGTLSRQSKTPALLDLNKHSRVTIVYPPFITRALQMAACPHWP
jgi:hypothetical protein